MSSGPGFFGHNLEDPNCLQWQAWRIYLLQLPNVKRCCVSLSLACSPGICKFCGCNHKKGDAQAIKQTRQHWELVTVIHEGVGCRLSAMLTWHRSVNVLTHD